MALKQQLPPTPLNSELCFCFPAQFYSRHIDVSRSRVLGWLYFNLMSDVSRWSPIGADSQSGRKQGDVHKWKHPDGGGFISVPPPSAVVPSAGVWRVAVRILSNLFMLRLLFRCQQTHRRLLTIFIENTGRNCGVYFPPGIQSLYPGFVPHFYTNVDLNLYQQTRPLNNIVSV